MLKEVVFYTTQQEKRQALGLANSRGKRMVHDDHNVGPEGEHRLTFGEPPGKSPDPPDPPDPILLRLDAIEARLAILEEVL